MYFDLRQVIDCLVQCFLKLDDVTILLYGYPTTLLEMEIAGTCCASLVELLNYLFTTDGTTDDYYDYDDYD